MSNIKSKGLMLGVMLAFASHCYAITTGELAKLNNEVLEIKAKTAVAKANADLAKYQTQPAAKVDPIAQTRPAAPPPKPKEVIVLRAIHGDVSNRIADLQYGLDVMPVQKGTDTYEGWRVYAVTSDCVFFAKKSSADARVFDQKELCMPGSAGAGKGQ